MNIGVILVPKKIVIWTHCVPLLSLGSHLYTNSVQIWWLDPNDLILLNADTTISKSVVKITNRIYLFGIV